MLGRENPIPQREAGRLKASWLQRIESVPRTLPTEQAGAEQQLQTPSSAQMKSELHRAPPPRPTPWGQRQGPVGVCLEQPSPSSRQASAPLSATQRLAGVSLQSPGLCRWRSSPSAWTVRVQPHLQVTLGQFGGQALLVGWSHLRPVGGDTL